MVFAEGTRAAASDGESVAALDLGSSSFRLLRGEWRGGRFRPRIDLSRHVGLARWVRADGRLEAAGQARALAVLEELGPLVADLEPRQVWVVGTASLRVLRDGEAFHRAVEGSLGHPLRIIDGSEEAWLTYSGAVGSCSIGTPGPYLVVDLGGASTELALGPGPVPDQTLSLPCGCATLAPARISTPHPLDPDSLEGLCGRVRALLPPELSGFRNGTVRTVLAAPGVIRTLAGLAGSPGRITVPGLARVRRRLEEDGGASGLLPAGAPAHHCRLLPGAWAILSVLSEELDLTELREARAGLREGMVRGLSVAASPALPPD